MPRIHEIIPVETDKVEVAKSLVDEAINTFAKKADHFMGQVRKVEMYADDRQGENTTDIKEVVETVDAKLDHVWGALSPALDLTMAKENSNTSTEARADVIVNGEVILAGLPATALLALEKRVGQIKNLYAAIPTLDPSVNWVLDEAAALPGTFRTAYPQEAQKTEKTLEHKVLYDATKEHPAQVAEYSVDRNVGKITLNRQSGLVSPATKAEWLRRISDLATAVKEARQRANMAEVQRLDVGGDIQTFIHG
jgi:hypothetical protein